MNIKKDLLLWLPSLLLCCAAPSAYAMTHAQGEMLSAQARAGDASALRTLEKAAKSGDKTAENWLGIYYGVQKEYRNAVFWSRKAAIQGDPLAEFVMGEVYYYGNGVPKSDRIALYWYKLAVAQGYQGAQAMLTKVRQEIAAQAELRDHTQAVARTDAQPPAGASSSTSVTPISDNKVVSTTAIKSTTPVAVTRPSSASLTAKEQNLLGYAYYSGQGKPKNYEKAVYWYRKAVAQGDAGAENNLGVAYNYGKGVDKNFSRAVYWYRKAADQGNPSAQTNLGIAYYQGDGVKSSTKEALHWWSKAAKQGDARARSYLNVVKLTSQGVQ
ncbi:tetratricopeptide repeat protein [Acidithiobacillus ferridurans]|uniref:tetratricopeptide repeat protein n=1 Tax=Acidithiobacillus ferridurans TaxID=1232575 RepID=UPI0029C0F7A2|nr:tetratricopeptide repeat protein [Acidithiobacillus ferridurans]